MITIFCRHSFVCPNQGPGRLRRLVGDILLVLAVLLIADVIFVMLARINAESI